MPYKDPARRKQAREQWRKKAYTEAYMKWLYARRMLPREQAELFQRALEELAKEGNETARDALSRGVALAETVGNRFDHKGDRPYYINERS